ncbi:hypothetical protein EMPS_00606 [Entomortierella parvispora]|uniref:Uncharacterized protein n=1 Tax=Entomortierella parvispora TaxID=205924 RepID=A0A9P3LS51_9FUNG|nr:hypothetical protein EMPS_00606 [Entomortierella parvispora]
MSRAGGVLRADVNGDGQGMADYATAIDAHLAVRTLSGETLRGKALIVRHMDPSRDLDWDKYRKFVRFREHNHYHPSRERNHLGRYLSSYHSRWYLDSYHDRRQERYRCRSRTRSRSPSRRVDARNGKTQRTWDRRRSRSHILESRYRNENDRVLRLDRQRSDSRSPERGPRGHRGRGVNR